jgi:hypothetical protein
MKESMFECDWDCVVGMEQMGVGVEEILQYAKCVLTHNDVGALLDHLGGLVVGKQAPRDSPPAHRGQRPGR